MQRGLKLQAVKICLDWGVAAVIEKFHRSELHKSVNFDLRKVLLLEPAREFSSKAIGVCKGVWQGIH